MANTVIALKKSAIPSSVPSNLANGELAINYADGKLYYRSANGTIASISGNEPNYFGTVNANNTLVVSDTPGDVFTLASGNNIAITGDAINDKITVGLTNDVTLPGILTLKAVGGDEGGELHLANALTNSTLAGEIVVDIYQNKLRFFESGGTNRGVFIDLSAASTGVGTDLLASSGSVDSTARQWATGAFDKANNAYAQANAAYDAANNAVTDFSPAFNQANTARNQANNAYIAANNAFSKGFLVLTNTSTVLDGSTGNVWGGSFNSNLRDTYSGIYNPNTTTALFTFASGSSSVMSVQVDGSIFVGEGYTTDAFGVIPSYGGWIVASSGIKSVNNIYAGVDLQATANVIVGSYAVFPDNTSQNTAYTTEVIQQANIARSHANAAFLQANAAFNAANNAVTDFSPAFNQANAAFAKANAALPNTSGVTFNGNLNVSQNVSADKFIATNNGNSENFRVGDDAWIGDFNVSNTIKIKGVQNSQIAYISFGTGDAKALGRDGTGHLTYDSNIVWHQGNDGSGSGLDADLLDGQNGTYYGRADDVTAAFALGNNAFARANTANITADRAWNHANAAFATINSAFGVANTALPNTSGVSFNGNLNFPTGNVGIGTNSPTYPLQVAATGKASYIGGVLVGANGTDIKGSLGVLSLQSNGSNEIQFWTNSGEKVRVDGSGNVLIGRTSSTIGSGVKLDIAGAANASNLLVNGNMVFTHANDGAGSNFDADLLDGQHGSYYGIATDVTAANRVANAAFLHANASYIFANSAHAIANLAFAHANAAFATVNSAFGVANNALPKTGGSITGNLAITGSLTVQGNVYLQDTVTVKVSDPLLYLAGNNYTSDIVDIGFVGNYVNATGQNVHTGLFRDATIKEYYLFEGYDKEPDPNHIDTAGNNFTVSVLNATVKTSNLILGGINTIPWITASFNHANAAHATANAAFASANAGQATANAAFVRANTANITADRSWNHANAAFATINSAFGVVNTAVQNTASVTFSGNSVFALYPYFDADAISTSNLYSRVASGFYQTSAGTTANGWPVDTNSWQYALSVTHSNDANYYAMQLAGSFYSQDWYLRSTNSSGATSWSKIWHNNNDGAGSGLDADLLDGQNGSYYGIATDVTGAFVQANTARTHANVSFEQANTARTQANDAYTRANSGVTVIQTDVLNATRYIMFTDKTTGTLANANVATTFAYNPSTGALSGTSATFTGVLKSAGLQDSSSRTLLIKDSTGTVVWGN